MNERAETSITFIANRYNLPTSKDGTSMVVDQDRTAKAAKADDAVVPTELWDLRILRVFKPDGKTTNSIPTWFNLGILRSINIL